MLNVKFNNIKEFQIYIHDQYINLFNNNAYEEFFKNEYNHPSQIFISYFRKWNKYYLITRYSCLFLILMSFFVINFISFIYDLPIKWNSHLILSVFTFLISIIILINIIHMYFHINTYELYLYIKTQIKKENIT